VLRDKESCRCLCAFTTHSHWKYPILQGSAVILEETNHLAIGLWSLYAVVTLVWRYVLSVISSRFRLKWRSDTPMIIRMPNWFWFPKNVAHFPEYDFHQRNRIQQREIEAELYTRTHACNSKTHFGYFIHRTIENVFGSIFFIFYKKAIQLNHEFLADEKVSERL
jgi:hypothetical protein